MNAKWKEEYEHYLTEPLSLSSGVYSQSEYNWKVANFPKTFFKYANLNNDNYINSVKQDYLYLCSIDRFEDDYECCATALFRQKPIMQYRKIMEYLPAIKKIVGSSISEQQYVDMIKIAETEMWSTEKFLSTLFEKASFPVDMAKQGLNRIAQCISEQEGVINSAFKKFLLDEYLIGCLTHDNRSNAMWQKYAIDYTGMCIEYGIMSIIQNCFPVYYYDELPEMQFIADGLLFHYAVCRKLRKWEFEQELRIISDRKAGQCFPLTAKSITITDKCCRRHEIETLAQTKGIPLYVVTQNEISSIMI